MSEKEPEILYHYCGLESFRSIITNRSIWLSDISKSNDSQELTWIRKQAKDHLQKKLDAITHSDGNTQIKKEICDLISHMEQNEAVTFAFCLSEKEDDLGQWRGYADDGRGIAIGFYRNKLDRLAKKIDEIHGMLQLQDENGVFVSQAGLHRVEYKCEDFLSSVDGLIAHNKQQIEETDDYILHPVVKQLAESMDDDKQMLAKVFVQVQQPLYKNPFFQAEAEWRLHISESKDILLNYGCEETNENDENAVSHLKIGYVTKNNTLVAHIELRILRFEELIAKIIIGPKCNLSIREMKTFLSVYNLRQMGAIIPRVLKSMEPYR